MQTTCKQLLPGCLLLGLGVARGAPHFFEGPLYLAFFCQKIRFSYTYETRGRVILKIYSCKHASKQIKKPEFRSFDCYISLIYIGVTSKSRTGAFFMSYLCIAKRENEPPEALLNHAEAEQRPRRGRESGVGRKDLSALTLPCEAMRPSAAKRRQLKPRDV